MAFTTAEEAQLRQLIAQEPALLSLAGNEATITSKLGATKVNPSQLPAASSLNDADIMLVRQGTADKSVSGSILKNYVGYGSATETSQGIVELATAAETQAGSDNVRAVHPMGLRSAMASVVGSVRTAKFSISSPSTTGTFTADEIVVESTLGGNLWRIANFSQSINLATTGAGGMDTGLAPVSGFVALYAFYNSSNATKTILGVDCTSITAPEVYGGATPPAGYNASALIGVFPTNASRQFPVLSLSDRSVSFSNTGVLATSAQGTNTSFSISAAAPRNAKKVKGYVAMFSNSASSFTFTISGNPNVVGAQQYSGYSASSGSSSGSPIFLDVMNTQTLYYSSSNSAGTPTYSVFISSYDF